MIRLLRPHRLSLSFASKVKYLQNIKLCSLSSMPAENKKTDVKMNPEISIMPKKTGTTSSINKLINQIDPLAKQQTLFSETLEISKDNFSKELLLDKTPLSFDEIPCPTILRLWEKYWKYIPLLGQLPWGKKLKFLMPIRYLFNEYGPVVRLHGALTNDIVIIHRPEHIAEVLRQENEKPIRSGFDTLHYYRVNLRKYKLPGLFSVQGPEWLEIRSKIEHPLNEEIYKMAGKITIACDELVQRICSVRNRQDEVPEDFINDLTRWGIECFSIFLLNKKLGFLEPSGYNAASEQVKFTETLSQAHKYMSFCESGFQVWRFFETPYSKKLFNACDIIDGIISKHIRQAEINLRNYSSEGTSDTDFSLIEQLLYRQQLQPEDISTLLMDSVILGVLATVNTQAFLLYSIAKNPRIQNKIYEEITTVAPDGRSMNREKLMKMVYLKACLKECLRLFPAFPYISRMLQKPITLHGYSIPKGTYIIMANQISSLREENFEDPEKYKPERWLSVSGKLSQQQEYSCLPFGHGIRSCVGKSMAEMQILLLTSTLLRKFKLEYDYANIRSKYLMVNVPNKPLRFRFIDRKSK